MSLSLVIASFQTGTYTVTRRASDTYTAGIRTVGASSTFTIDASLQPVTGRDLRALPEGRRAEDFRVLWTKSAELRLEPNPDTIAIGSETFEIYRVFGYSILEPTFYRVLIARQGTA